MKPRYLFSALAASSIFMGASAFAQTAATPTPAPTLPTGTAGGAPGGLNINVNMPKVNLKDLGTGIYKVGKFMTNRIHTIGVQGIVSDMRNAGVSKKYFVASFEGAIVYHHEINEDQVNYWRDLGRNAGAQILPFKVEINGAQNLVEFSGFSFKNMNKLENSVHATDNSFFKYMDRVDFLTFTWDDHMSFNNIRSFDFTVVQSTAKLALASSQDGKTYLALSVGGNSGGRVTNIDEIRDYGYENYKNASNKGNRMGFKAEYNGGVELNIATKKDVNINLKSSWINGHNTIAVNNLSNANQNKINTAAYDVLSAQYDTDHAQYQLNLDQWNIDKAAYEASNGGVPVSDATFINSPSGYAKPTDATKPTAPKPIDTDQTLKRNYGYIKSTVDVSFPIKSSKRGMRLGVAVDVNLIQFDRVKNDSEKNFGSSTLFHLKNNNNQMLRGRIYFTF